MEPISLKHGILIAAVTTRPKKSAAVCMLRCSVGRNYSPNCMNSFSSAAGEVGASGGHHADLLCEEGACRVHF